MDQDKLWDYLQNEGLQPDTFSEARPRFLLRFLRPGSRVLNVGVGAGALERLSLAKGIEIHTLDPNARAVERVRDMLNLGPRAQVGYAEAMPFEDARFDTVVMAEVIEHLDDKALDGALREAWRTIATDGRLLVTTPYRENLRDNTVLCPHCGKMFHKFGHAQTFDKHQIAELLRRHRFAVESLSVTAFIDWRRPGILNAVKSIARLFLARLGEQFADPHLVVVGRKLLT